jgi:protein-disulfide isomerase
MDQSVGRLRTMLDVVAALSMIAASVAIVIAVTTGIEPRPAAVERDGRPTPVPLPTAPVAIGDTPVMGVASAKVVVIAYSDFQCSFCARFSKETMPLLFREYVQTGKVKFGLRHLPIERIHPRAFRAAEAAECAGTEGKFWPMHDVLFENPRSLEERNLSEYSARIGVPNRAFDRCMQEGRAEKVRRDIASARQLGIAGTPSFLFGIVQPDGGVSVRERMSGARPLVEFQQILDKLLKGL